MHLGSGACESIFKAEKKLPTSLSVYSQADLNPLQSLAKCELLSLKTTMLYKLFWARLLKSCIYSLLCKEGMYAQQWKATCVPITYVTFIRLQVPSHSTLSPQKFQTRLSTSQNVLETLLFHASLTSLYLQIITMGPFEANYFFSLQFFLLSCIKPCIAML